MEIMTALDAINGLDQHYLVKARKEGLRYFDEFLQAATIMHQLLTPKEFDYWCQEKMLLKLQPFQEKTFIQYAVETSVVRYFGEKFPVGFKVEAKINPENDKDVDCRFNSDRFTYNVEVKCSDFKSKEKIDVLHGIKFGTIGRIPERQETIDKLVALIQEVPLQTEELKDHHEMKNMDNNLKDFLELANEKFNANTPANELNILVVGCDDANDIQNWFYYLWADQGLFTPNSFTDSAKYNNVDLGVFTNLYFKHNHFFDKRVSNSWSLSDTFNLLFPNPLRKSNKKDAFFHFIEIFNHYSNELSVYNVPGDAPDYVKNTQRITYFVKRFLEEQKGLYLFESPVES